MMKTRKRWLSILLGGAIAVGGSIGVAAPANAAVVVGVCTIKLDEPHGSGHVSGTIDSNGVVQCSLGMPNIYVKTILHRDNGQTANGPTEDLYNTDPWKIVNSVAWVPCAGNQGTWQASLSVVLRSPAGTNPQYHANTYWSIWRNVACGNSFAPASENASPGNESPNAVTVTFLSDGTVQESVPDGVQVGEFIG